MPKTIFISMWTAGFILGGCVAPNANTEREKLEAYDFGKPLPSVEDTETRDSSFGDCETPR